MERKKQRAVRLIVTATREELKAIDDFRFANHMPSRASAVRELLQRGLRVPNGSRASRAGKPGSWSHAAQIKTYERRTQARRRSTALPASSITQNPWSPPHPGCV